MMGPVQSSGNISFNYFSFHFQFLHVQMSLAIYDGKFISTINSDLCAYMGYVGIKNGPASLFYLIAQSSTLVAIQLRHRFVDT